jgi:pimeloyl-ACP methyl ester carboxylesterase
MPNFLFLAGPPTGALLWNAVLERIESRGATASAIDILTLGEGCESPADWVHQLTQRLQAGSPSVLVAHGTAVPLALHAAAAAPPAGLVLTNGPLGPMTPTMRTMCRSLRMLGPKAVLKLLASPAGLRRTVVNPYVWDYDTVVTICGPLFEDPGCRTLTRGFLGALSEWTESPASTTAPTAHIYGDSDRLLSPYNADHVESWATLQTIEGGHHYHPLERPWEIADRVIDWAQSTLTTT